MYIIKVYLHKHKISILVQFILKGANVVKKRISSNIRSNSAQVLSNLLDLDFKN